jgi:hypothetical protein
MIECCIKDIAETEIGEQKAELERIAKEKERDRQRRVGERLAKEKAERAAKEEAEKAKRENLEKVLTLTPTPKTNP